VVVDPKTITRLQVQDWIDEWVDDDSGDKPSLPNFIRKKVEENVEDPVIMQAQGEDLVPVDFAEKIIDDLPSYNVPPGI
jgi:hypothetical protein